MEDNNTKLAKSKARKIRSVFVLVLVVFILLSGICLAWKYSKLPAKVCFGDNCFQVEVARNEQARRKGLMYREKLDLNEGMLFILDNEANHPFWMKNTKIPLDIIWINKDKKVVAVMGADPCNIEDCPKYDPKVDSIYVLEINAGLADKHSIKVGDEVSF